MVALLSAEEYEKAATTSRRIIWGTVLTAVVAASLLIATGTIALLGAIAAVVASTSLVDQRLARTRVLKFLPVLLLGIVVQGLWMHRKPAPAEWPLPGYPGAYLEQVKLKSGNHPELGMAKWSDIPTRVKTNLLVESEILGGAGLAPRDQSEKGGSNSHSNLTHRNRMGLFHLEITRYGINRLVFCRL
jgi:hypothetical protein